MIYIGTSGYSYPDWAGTFYEKNIEKGQMLVEYAKRFRFAEIDSTYYSMPNRFLFLNMVKKTPGDFKFAVKLHSSMTHSRDAGPNEYAQFNDALTPLDESKKLGCLVAQFPYSFHRSDENIDYIKKMREQLGNYPVCAEFRNSQWLDAETYKFLSSQEIGFICVDEPDISGLVKPMSIVTSGIGYVRFHGRNNAKWYNHKESYERYNYLYTIDELEEWLPRIGFIEENTEITFIAFNNHFRAQGAINAAMLRKLIDEGNN